MFLGEADGPVWTESQSEEQQVEREGGTEEEEGEQDERDCFSLYPGSPGVELSHHQEADNEAEETLVGEVCGDEDPGCPHEQLGSQEEEPEEGPRPAGPADGGDPEPAVHQAEDDHSRGLAVTRGNARPRLTGERALHQRDVEAALRDPPVGPVTLEQPLPGLGRNNQTSAQSHHENRKSHHVDPFADDESSEKFDSLHIVES